MPAIHNYKCKTCSYFFEAFFEAMDDATESHPCPRCGRKANKKLSPPKFKVAKSIPERAGRLKDKKFAEEFCKEHIRRSKKRIEGHKFQYAKYTYDPKLDKRKGADRPRRLTDQEIQAKLKAAKKITIDVHKRAGKLKDLGDSCQI